MLFPYYTMLQKLSKCEVKAWLFWNLIILPPLRFCVKSNFGQFKQPKKVIFGKFQSSECQKLPKWHFWTVWIHQNLILHKNLSGSKIIKFQKSQALTSQCESFWSIVLTFPNMSGLWYLYCTIFFFWSCWPLFSVGCKSMVWRESLRFRSFPNIVYTSLKNRYS